ncbi:MAG: hypothetical protein R3F29_11615 [Planctomycetota bacterium]
MAELERVRSSLDRSRREHADDAELRSLAASRAINALKVHYQRGDFDAAAAAGQEGFAQVAEGGCASMRDGQAARAVRWSSAC